MLVALLSDIHDHTTHLLQALHAAKENQCTHLLFMGDMTRYSTFHTLRREWPHPIDLVFGNNEYEKLKFQQAAQQWHSVKLHGDSAELVLDGRHIFFCHFPWHAHKAVSFGDFDAVFFGHTHEPYNQHVGKTLVANPGEVYGRQSPPSIGIYDTSLNTVRIVRI